MSTHHLPPDLLVDLEEAGEIPRLRRLAGHVAHHCPRCAEDLAAAGFAGGENGPCWRLDELRELFEPGQDPLLWGLLLHAAVVCPGCREGLAPLPALLEAGELPAEPVPSLRLLAFAFARHRSRQTVEELLPLRPKVARARLMELPGPASWGVAEALCRNSHRLAGSAPRQALEVARLAEFAAERATLHWQDESAREYLRMLASAHRGNALRLLDDLHGGEDAYNQAERIFEAAPEDLDPISTGLRAQVLRLRASLYVDQRRFQSALADLHEALLLAESSFELPEFFRANVYLLFVHTYQCMGRSEKACNASQQALFDLPADRVPRLHLIAKQGQLVALVDLGRFNEATELLPHIKQLRDEAGTVQDRLRIDWAEARLAGATGDLERAERLFTKVRKGFLAEGSGIRAAGVTIELAQVLFQTGKVALVRPLAADMWAIFQAKDLHREAAAALALFQEAALTEALSAQLLERLVRYFHRAQYNQRLRFRAG